VTAADLPPVPLAKVSLIKGSPSDAELAALLGVITAVRAARAVETAPPFAPERDAWRDPRRELSRQREFVAGLSRWGVSPGERR